MAAAQSRLTLSEAGVAHLVAQGRTNEEVAALLAMQPKTVQGQLARVYRKLGVRSRTELALLLAAVPIQKQKEEER